MYEDYCGTCGLPLTNHYQIVMSLNLNDKNKYCSVLCARIKQKDPSQPLRIIEKYKIRNVWEEEIII